jgi:plasmid stabilization system protein ParE
LFEQAPGRAADVVREIYDAPVRLAAFPQMGRTGKKADTREVYQISGDVIHIVRILHGAQNWP